MNPLVSVIIPTYNRAGLIKDTIISVLKQTYKNFELIIADDGSTDNTAEVISSIPDSRIFYLPLSHTGLPACSRNKAIQSCQGDFIAFLDSDDLWMPKKLHICLSCFECIPSLGLVCSNEFLLQKNSMPNLETVQKRRGKDNFIDFQRLFMRNIISSSTAVVRRECLDTVGLFIESKDFRAVEDYHLWLRIAAKYPIYYIDEPLGYYRVHEGSIRLNTGESLMSLYNTLIDICRQFPDLIKPFHRSAARRIRSLKIAILKYYLGQKRLINSLKWIYKILMFSSSENLTVKSKIFWTSDKHIDY